MFGRLFLALPALLLVAVVASLAPHGPHSAGLHTLRILLVPALIAGFLVWREWKVWRDRDFAAAQAARDGSPAARRRQVALIAFIVWLGVVYFLTHSSVWPDGQDSFAFGYGLMMVSFIGLGAIGAWSFLRR